MTPQELDRAVAAILAEILVREIRAEDEMKVKAIASSNATVTKGQPLPDRAA
jgi:hypothetical protein